MAGVSSSLSPPLLTPSHHQPAALLPKSPGCSSPPPGVVPPSRLGTAPPAMLCAYCSWGAFKMQICSPHATARPSLALNTPALSGYFYSNRHNPCALNSALCTQPCLGSCTCSPSRPAPLSAPCHQPFLQSPCLRPSLHSSSDQHLVSLSQSWCQGHNHCFICMIPSCTSATPTSTGLGGHRVWCQGGPWPADGVRGLAQCPVSGS